MFEVLTDEIINFLSNEENYSSGKNYLRVNCKDLFAQFSENDDCPIMQFTADNRYVGTIYFNKFITGKDNKLYNNTFEAYHENMDVFRDCYLFFESFKNSKAISDYRAILKFYA